MKICISPAKGFKENKDIENDWINNILYNEKTGKIISALSKKSKAELMELYKVSEKIAEENIERIDGLLNGGKTYTAIDTFDGLQYKALEIETLGEIEREYINRNVRIFSGMYGCIKPSDKIMPYSNK